MNNRFKFRVWDEVNNKFYSQEVLNALPLNVFLASKHIQQYIGLNDVNGNPIFEGDIVKFDDSEISEKPTIGIAEVIWTNDLTIVNAPSYGLWFINNIFNGKTGFYGHILGRIEVIGNIFNPPCKLDANLECLTCNNLVDDCPFRTDNKI